MVGDQILLVSPVGEEAGLRSDADGWGRDGFRKGRWFLAGSVVWAMAPGWRGDGHMEKGFAFGGATRDHAAMGQAGDTGASRWENGGEGWDGGGIGRTWGSRRIEEMALRSESEKFARGIGTSSIRERGVAGENGL